MGKLKARIELKTTPEVKALLKLAAQISGVSYTSFIVNSARNKAVEIIEADKKLRLNSEAWDKLEVLLDNPPMATEELKELLRDTSVPFKSSIDS